MPLSHKEALITLTNAIEYSAQTINELVHADPIYLELMGTLVAQGFFISADVE